MLIFVSHSFRTSTERKKLDRWLRWCIKSAPADLVFVVGVDHHALGDLALSERQRVERNNLDLLTKCDGLVLVGHLSPLMSAQRDAAERLGLKIVDSSGWSEPPYPMPYRFEAFRKEEVEALS